MFWKKPKKTISFDIKDLLKDNPPLESFYKACEGFLQGRSEKNL